MNDWLDLEHHLWRELQEQRLLPQKLLVGFSGGADSLALLWALHRVKKTGLAAAYIHHGPGGNTSYRDQAEQFCRDFCERHQIPFFVQKYEGASLSSEAELREFRHRSLEHLRKQTGSDLLALAHHREDLLETRILRLIRGTGPQGLVAMRVLQGTFFRPFLKISKKDLLVYLEKYALSALEDPSNQDLHPLRNWLRQDWLRALEERQEGALNSLGRSLEALAEMGAVEELPEGLVIDQGLSRSHFLAASSSQQKRALARLLLQEGVRNFSQAHLEEIQKRLDNSQKDFTFRVGGVEWVVNAQQIRVQKAE